MALVVEDGTGVVGAESYASVDDAGAYWEKRPQNPLYLVWATRAVDPSSAEGALREASSYLDTNFAASYLGQRATLTQGLLWPRIPVPPKTNALGLPVPLYPRHGISRPWDSRYMPGLVAFVADPDVDPADVTLPGADGLALAPLPAQIVNATIELAARALNGPLSIDFVPGQRLKSERAGDEENVYFDDGRTGAVYGFLAPMLANVLGSGGQGGWSWR
jgi:hypothetical protein